jgi:YbbR domain-containing protein
MTKRKTNETGQKAIRIALAIAAAILLWLYINGSSIDLISRDIEGVPVTLTNTDVLASKGLVLSENQNYYVNLRVRGTDKNLNSIDVSEITAKVDLKDIDTAGTYSPKIEVSGLSNTVILDEVKPGNLSLTVDAITDKKYDVTVVTDGKPADDNTVVSAKARDQVTVNGSSEELAKLSKVSGVAQVQGMSEDSNQYVTVKAYDSQGNELTDLDVSPRAVPVEIIIGKTKPVSVTSPGVSGDVASGYKVTGVTVSPANVTIGGKQEALDSVGTLALSDINVAGANSNVTREVKLNLPEGVYLMDSSGDTVSVTVSVEELTEKSYTVDKIEPRNLGAGLSVSKIQDSSVVVKVKGTASELDNIRGTDISAWLDLSGKTKGRYDVQVQVQVPEGSVENISPQTTSVTIN